MPRKLLDGALVYVFSTLCAVNCWAAELPVSAATRHSPQSTSITEISGLHRIWVNPGGAMESMCCEVRRTSIIPMLATPVFTSSPRQVDTGQTVSRHQSRGGAIPVIPASPDWTGTTDAAAARTCFVTDSPGYVTMDVNFGEAPGDFVFDCILTTLFGGFNTSATDFNFLELTNTLPDATLYPLVYAYDEVSGRVVMNYQQLTVGPGRRLDIDFHSLAGSGAFGVVKIVHTGPPDSLKAVMSQYKITSTSPLDFTPTGRDVFERR